MTNKNTDPSKPVVVCPGPTSEAGRAISSRNALRHGCCSTETLILPTENEQDFKALESTWLKAYNPQSEAERHLVAELVQADWFLQRATRTYADMEAKLLAEQPNPLDWTEQQDRKLGRFLRYKTANFNIFLKCRKAVEDYRKARASEKMYDQKLVLLQERVKATQKKNQPEPTWKEHLEGMRQRAISLGYTPPDPSKI
jgi:hypothetical protein